MYHGTIQMSMKRRFTEKDEKHIIKKRSEKNRRREGDPGMKRNGLSILFPRQDEVTYQEIPEETWHDLGLDAITEKVAAKPQEIPLLRRVMMNLTADPEVAVFRAAVFEDMIRHPEIRNRLMTLLDKVKMFYDYGVVNRHTGDEASIWDLMHRLEEYHEYILTVEAIRECLGEKDLESEGLKTLRDTIDGIYRDHGFAALRKDVEELRVAASDVKSITVGINLNERFEAISLGLVSVNGKAFTRSGILKNFLAAVSPKNEIQKEADWNGSYGFYPANGEGGVAATMEKAGGVAVAIRNPLMAMSMARVPEGDGTGNVPRQMDSAASMLTSRIVRKLKDTLGKYVHISVKEISDLIPELVFYTRWAEYIERLKAEGWNFCRPEVFIPSGERAEMVAEGFYNLKLIATEQPSSVVLNDLTFDREKRVYVLTGANRGGKTTVTQAVGQLFLLAQSGIQVPAIRFRYDPADRVLTHFPADEDRTLDLGRLGEECRRFRELYVSCGPRSLLLLNETFSTTSFEEGYYIASDAIRAILRRDARTIYNTHMHKLAQDLDTVINQEDLEGKAVSLVSETRKGQHSFRVTIAPPEGKSFARDIAEKYGVTFEKLTEM